MLLYIYILGYWPCATRPSAHISIFTISLFCHVHHFCAVIIIIIISTIPQRNLKDYSYRGRQRNTSSSNSFTKAKCYRCGIEPHSRLNCPAKDAVCSKCGKLNHFAAVCRTNISTSELTSTPSDVAFLDQLTPGTKGNAWFTHIDICGLATAFKIDTGSEVTAGNSQHLGQPTLNTPDRKLFGPSTQPLKVLGLFKGNISHKGRGLTTNNICDKGTHNKSATSYHCPTTYLCLQTVQTKADILQQFPKVFKGLGEEFEIKLQPDAQPFALTTPHNIALPLRPKVAQELARMEAMGVISKVNEPTPWCAGMVVVPKKSGNVRICVDLKSLNKSILHEVHPLPKVDETLAQLSGAKVFTKLDANSGFWQIPLSKQSRLFTTFITPIGRYCFNKLPFGISSAPEHFQKRMSAILSGLEGVVCQMDEVLVFGKDQTEHGARLSYVLIE